MTQFMRSAFMGMLGLILCVGVLVSITHARESDELMLTRQKTLLDVAGSTPIVCRQYLAIKTLLQFIEEKNYDGMLAMRSFLVENSICYVWQNSEVDITYNRIERHDINRAQLKDHVVAEVYQIDVIFAYADGTRGTEQNYLAVVEQVDPLKILSRRVKGFL